MRKIPKTNFHCRNQSSLKINENKTPHLFLPKINQTYNNLRKSPMKNIKLLNFNKTNNTDSEIKYFIIYKFILFIMKK